MHYKCLLFTKEFPTEEMISDILRPFNEDVIYANCDGGSVPFVIAWDWYRIGGRYNGSLKLDVASQENMKKYGINYYSQNSRNGRLFWSYLLTKMNGRPKPGTLSFEEDYFNSMGCRDGWLYVDGGAVSDITNIYEVGCYCFVDSNGEPFSRSIWDGNNHVETENFDKMLHETITKNNDGFVTVVDLHR